MLTNLVYYLLSKESRLKAASTQKARSSATSPAMGSLLSLNSSSLPLHRTTQQELKAYLCKPLFSVRADAE